MGEYHLCSLECSYEYTDNKNIPLDELISVEKFPAAGMGIYEGVTHAWHLIFAGWIKKTMFSKEKKEKKPNTREMSREDRKAFKKAKKDKAKLAKTC